MVAIITRGEEAPYSARQELMKLETASGSQ
jgi:hypothetical protein